jgi:GNAT superfamily N-acetyltransferase
MVSIEAATADRWDDVATVMGSRGDPSRCWCQYFRSETGPFVIEDRDGNRAAMRRQLTTATVPHGLVAYDGERPVGWCALAPRADYPRIEHMRVPAAVPAEPGTWSVTCFVVRVGHRRSGVAGELLAAAVDFAARHGAKTLEGYPFDVSVRRTSAANLFVGTLSMFERAGFVEVARPFPGRPVVRLTLSAPGSGGIRRS